MPYRTVADLPEAQVDQYSTHQKHAFLEAFNNALEEYGDEGRAFATAHAAAQRSPERKRRDGDDGDAGGDGKRSGKRTTD